jgi:tetratricopeptide (TPR) repeat protein
MSDAINPNQLFKTLKLKANGQIKGLWDNQKEVLDLYFNKFKDSKKLAIELPTGSGKSIVSVLILEMWRQTGKRVAVLTSSIALGDDMKRRCDDLGIPNVVISGAERAAKLGENETRERLKAIKDYKRGYAIGIMNYWAYMLCKDIALPDVLVIDDADSFENLLVDQYSVVISKKEDPSIYADIVKELLKHPIYQGIETLEALPNSEDVVLIYFPHSIEMVSRLKKFLSAQTPISNNLHWALSKNKNSMHTYLMFVSGREIVLVPYIIVGAMHERLRDISQIIYTSATLGTAERLHKTMGSFEIISILNEKDLESQIGTMGSRIIFPLNDVCTSGKIDDKVLESINKLMISYKKILIMCNSIVDAEGIIEFIQSNGMKAALYKSELDSTRFASESVGALVAAGRFIGLDLSSKVCGVAVVTRMPYILSPVDLLVKNILEDIQYSDEKVSHRLVQAFGRCNRNPEDRAIYFMFDSKLAADISGNERIYQHFPKRMKAELDVGQEFADLGGLQKAIETGALFLENKNPEINDEILERATKVVERKPQIFQKPFLYEIRGWFDLTERLSYLDAAQNFEKCLEHYRQIQQPDNILNKQIAWLNYTTAYSFYLAYLYFDNEQYKQEAIKHLELSKQLGYTSWFNGLQVAINELKEKKEEETTTFNIELQSFKESLLRKWNEFYLANSFGKRNPFQTWASFREILNSGTHDAICASLEQVLELMGFEVTVIKRTPGKPDIIAFSGTGQRYVVIIEVKTKETSDMLKTDQIDQIGGHKAFYQAKYPDRPIYSVLFTTKSQVAEDAVSKARNYVRILRSSEFTVLMNKYFDLMESGWKIEEPMERIVFAEKIPSLEKFEIIFKPNKEPIATLDDIHSVMG